MDLKRHCFWAGVNSWGQNAANIIKSQYCWHLSLKDFDERGGVGVY